VISPRGDGASPVVLGAARQVARRIAVHVEPGLELETLREVLRRRGLAALRSVSPEAHRQVGRLVGGSVSWLVG
jgi:hypothetical protein